MHRASAISILLVGSLGVLLGLVVTLVGTGVVSRATGTALDVLALTETAVAATDESLAAAVTAVTAAGSVVEAAGAAGVVAGDGMREVGPQLESTADMLEADVADAVGAAVDSLPAVISSAALIDQALRVMSVVGVVEYAPETPLAAALTDLQTALVPLPDQLRGQADTLRTISGVSVDTGDQLVVLSDELAVLAVAVADAERLLGNYGSGIEDTRVAVVDLGDQVRSLRLPLMLMTLVGGLVMVVSQLVPLLVGAGMLGRGPLRMLAQGDHYHGDTADHGGRGVEPGPA